MSDLFAHFFAMGGYGFYVWTAYFIVFLILTCNFIASYRRHARKKREIARKFSSSDESTS